MSRALHVWRNCHWQAYCCTSLVSVTSFLSSGHNWKPDFPILSTLAASCDFQKRKLFHGTLHHCRFSLVIKHLLHIEFRNTYSAPQHQLWLASYWNAKKTGKMPILNLIERSKCEMQTLLKESSTLSVSSPVCNQLIFSYIALAFHASEDFCCCWPCTVACS